MKNSLFLTVILLLFPLLAGAQDATTVLNDDDRPVPEGIVPGMKYSEYAKLYDPRSYVEQKGDRYSPVWGGIASAIIPGLGQMVNGELGRGFTFFGAYAGCFVLATLGTSNVSPNNNAGGIISGIAFAGMIATGVWSIVDGVRVGEIKNLYARDTESMSAISVRMDPFFAKAASTTSGQAAAAGLKLTVSF